jgi:hypothetical protein
MTNGGPPLPPQRALSLHPIRMVMQQAGIGLSADRVPVPRSRDNSRRRNPHLRVTLQATEVPKQPQNPPYHHRH